MPIVPGPAFSHTFPTAGTFTYFCKVHAYDIGGSWAGMVGTVIVEPSAADALNTLSAVSYAALAVAVVALLFGIYALGRERKPQGKTPRCPLGRFAGTRRPAL